MSKEQQMIAANTALMNAKTFAESLLLEYQAALMRYDWPAAETARAKYIASVEALMDQFAVLYRILEKA